MVVHGWRFSEYEQAESKMEMTKRLRLSRSKLRADRALDYALPSAAVVFAAAVALYIGRHGVQHFDMGNIADAGWRIYLGQVHYRDFSMVLMPVTFYMQAVFFAVFGGFEWISLVWHAAVLNAAAALVTYVIARRRLGHWTAAGCAALAAVTFYGPSSFPYHDHTAFFFVLLSVFLLDLRPNATGARRTAIDALVGVVLALALFSKVSIGLAAVPAVGFILIADSFRTRDDLHGTVVSLFTMMAAFVIVAAAMTAYFELQGSFLEGMATVSQQSDRLGRFFSVTTWTGRFGSVAQGVSSISLFLLVGLCVWLVADARRLLRHRETLAPLFARLLAIASLHVFAAVTSQFHSLVFQPLLGVLMCYLIMLFRTANTIQAYDSPIGVVLIRWLSRNGTWLAAVALLALVLGLGRGVATPTGTIFGKYSANNVAIFATFWP